VGRTRSKAWNYLVPFALAGSVLASPALIGNAHADVTVASDDFNRANGGLGGNWTAVAAGGLAISSDAAVGTAAAGAAGNAGMTGDVWSASSFGADQFSQVELTSAQLTGGEWIGPAVRVSAGGAACYVGIYYWNNGSPMLMLFLESGGGWTVLGSASTGPLGAGTQLELRAAGPKLSLLENGVPQVTATNSALSGGAPGILSFGDGQVDNWSGGTAVSASYPVGGSVSGLSSGSVVLADNGGDDLTVSANGTFTFATALADGSSYAVTVASQPSGQTCSVSGGSGTVSGGTVSSVLVSCAASGGSSGGGSSGTTASDDFNRANGGLGGNWTAVAAGGLAISSDAVVGTAGAGAAGNAGVTGDMWSASSFGADQFSQVELTSVQLTGGEWIGPAVRASAGGNGYVGIYYWNSGSPMLMLFLESGGGWTVLGSASTGPLGAGTQLEVTAAGSTVSLLENGVPQVTATNSALSGGAPGILAFGDGQVDNWSGGTASPPPPPPPFQVSYTRTDSSGIEYYDVTSPDNGPGTQVMRVLPPSNPAPGVKHNFLFVLPVEAGLGTVFGDGLATLQSLNAQNQYNLTIVEPSFSIDPWYADSSTDPDVQYESFMASELVPWVDANLATSGSEQNWLIGFSKSGIGGQDLILKHPNLFALAATWDFPADMASAGQFGSDSANGYGTNANFQQNYELTQAFVDARKAPFVASNRIWIGGYYYFGQDVSDYGALLTAEGIQHTTETPTYAAHTWTSGWVPIAMAALYQDSLRN
jgi:Putative esterase